MLREETLPHGTRLIDLGVFPDNLKQCSKCNSGYFVNKSFTREEILMIIIVPNKQYL